MKETVDGTDPMDFYFSIDGVFDALVKKVWDALTDENLLQQWFGPKECSVFKDGVPSMNRGWSGTFDQFEEYLKKT